MRRWSRLRSIARHFRTHTMVPSPTTGIGQTPSTWVQVTDGQSIMMTVSLATMPELAERGITSPAVTLSAFGSEPFSLSQALAYDWLLSTESDSVYPLHFRRFF